MAFSIDRFPVFTTDGQKARSKRLNRIERKLGISEDADENDGDCHTFSNPAKGEVLIGIDVRGATPLSKAIRFFQRADGTHAKFVRGNGKVIENFWPHVRERNWAPGEREKTQLFRIAGSTPEDWAKLEAWFDVQLRHPPSYSVRDLFRFAVNLPPKSGRTCFCSMWVLRGIRLNLSPCKQPLVRLEYQDYGSPSQIRTSPLAIQLVKKHGRDETNADRNKSSTG